MGRKPNPNIYRKIWSNKFPGDGGIPCKLCGKISLAGLKDEVYYLFVLQAGELEPKTGEELLNIFQLIGRVLFEVESDPNMRIPGRMAFPYKIAHDKVGSIFTPVCFNCVKKQWDVFRELIDGTDTSSTDSSCPSNSTNNTDDTSDVRR